MGTVYVICQERRQGALQPREGPERRLNPFLQVDNLQTCIDVQKWEYTTLLQDIYQKEDQKYRITYVCYSVFAVLAGLVSAITITLVKDAPRDDPLIYILLTVVAFGATLINATAMRYIMSLKREVFLVMRQLNCIRQSLQCLMHLLLEGKSPGQDFITKKGRQSGESFNPYFELFGRHINSTLSDQNTCVRSCG